MRGEAVLGAPLLQMTARGVPDAVRCLHQKNQRLCCKPNRLNVAQNLRLRLRWELPSTAQARHFLKSFWQGCPQLAKVLHCVREP